MNCLLQISPTVTIREKLGDITFAAATDGNHGRGVAWSAAQMGFKSVIYVHKLTSQGRIQAIENSGARVVVIDGNYDDAVRQVDQDAQRNGWEVVSDTSWDGYEDIPKWVMQGYTTMFSEAQEQLAAQGLNVEGDLDTIMVDLAFDEPTQSPGKS